MGTVEKYSAELCWAKRKGSSPAFPLFCTMNLRPYCPEAKKATCRDVSCMEKKNYSEAQTLGSAEMLFLVLEAFRPFGSVLAKALRNYFR